MKGLEKTKGEVKEAYMDMEVGKAFNFSTTLNPVISLEDKNEKGQAEDIVRLLWW